MASQKTQKSANFAPSKQKAKSEAVKKVLRVARQHRLNYDEFIYVCQQVRLKLKLKKEKKEKRLPELLSLAELKKFFKTIQKHGDIQHELMLKLLLYTAVRVSELVNIRVADVDADGCKIFIGNGKGGKDRYILFPSSFSLAIKAYLDAHNENEFLFESRLKQSYTSRRIQQIVRDYADQAGLERTVHPHLLRHQMLTFLTSQGISDAKIQLISGHESRKSLELYQHLSLEAVEKEYQSAIKALDI
ncbi:MAG: integrase [Cyanobacteria bacterium PR.023]|jgi:integrase/recombinase XerD|nr:integrase [Cyanobacteria bacterium PR.023]